MRSITDFIVHIPKDFKDSYKTESGMEIFADKRWSQRELASTLVKVIDTPLDYKGPIEKDDFVFIDNAAVMRQEHIKTGIHESHHLVDRDKRFYKIPPPLLIAYKKGSDNAWIGFNDNVLIHRKYKTVKSPSSSIIAPTSNTKKRVDGEGIVFVGNGHLTELGVNTSDEIMFNELGAIDTYLDNKPVTWIKNRHVFAKKNLN